MYKSISEPMNELSVQDEYDEIEEAYAEEKRLLMELEERFEKLKEEYDKVSFYLTVNRRRKSFVQIMEERAAEERQQALEKALRERRWRAAAQIQRFWQGYKVRKVMRLLVQRSLISS